MRKLTAVLLVLLACGGKPDAPTTPTLPPEGSGGSAASVPKPKEQREIWAGTVVMPSDLVDIIVTFVKHDGPWTATLAVPIAKAENIPLADVALEDAGMKFTLAKPNPAANEQYILQRSGDTATGAMVLAGHPFYVKLAKVADGAQPKSAIGRPQTPKPPFPYTDREVTIDAPETGVLAGTLSIPEGKGPFPAIVLISGSGQQDRDETIFGHRPLLVIADKLARAGFAVLRTDDRMTGKTKGTHTSLETDIGDGRAAFEWLAKQPEADPKRTGILGHSVGGLIAPTIAARTQKVAFIVSLAGPGVPGSELTPMQLEKILVASKTPPDVAAKIANAQRKLTAAVVKGDPKAIKAALREAILENVAATGGPKPDDKTIDAVVEQKVAEVTNPWVVSFFKADPAAAWRKVRCPVLALIGSKDLQVPAEPNLTKIAAALKQAGNKDVTTKTLEGLNHLYQHADTGLVEEYGVIEETFDPATLDLVAAWLVDKTKKK